MPERPTARDRLDRILLLLPLAAREEGVGMDEAARLLGTSVEEVDRSLREVADRAYYHPPETGSQIRVIRDPDRVRVRTSGGFRRPPRLTRPERVTLSVGLRVLARDHPERADELQGLAARLEEGLSSGGIGKEERAGFEVHPGRPTGDPLRALMVHAARERIRCRIRYLRPGDEEPDWRDVDPYLVAHAEARWYVLGHCGLRQDVRIFRMDRILDAAVTDESFRVPEAFDPEDYLEGGRVFDGTATAHREVTVRYRPAIARWIRERGWGEPEEDGSVVVRHPAADPEWAVRHVLGYGPDAEILAPEDLRTAVRERVREMAPGS